MSIYGTPVMLGGSGSGGGLWHRVRFFSYQGVFITSEFVADGDDCIFGAGRDWSTTQGGVAVSGITENVHTDLDLYSAVSTLLTNSIAANVLSEEFAENYVDGDTWGEFTLFGNGYEKRDDAVYLPTTASAQYLLNASDTVVTFYTVAKEVIVTGYDPNMIAAWYAEDSGYAPNFFNRHGVLFSSVYGNDSNLQISSLDYHVLAISLSSEKLANYYVDGIKQTPKQYSASGDNVTLGAVGSNHSIRPNECLYKYVAVLNGTETDATIIANMQTIMSYYGIS